MEFNLSDEQRLLRDSARRYVEQRCTLVVNRTPGSSGIGYSQERWREMAGMGWLGLPLPEEAGGLGLSMVEVALLMEQLGGGAMREPIVPTAVLAGTLIGNAKDWSRRVETLSAIALGDLAIALAHNEAGHHDMDRAGDTRAMREPDGFRLTGAKSPVLWGGSVDGFIVSATEPGAGSPSLFLVKPATPGVDRHSYPLIDGSQACDLVMRDALVDAGDRILGPEAGEAALAEALDRANLALVAEALGTMEAVLRVSSEYIKARVQFGQPIGKFQALQHIIADMFVETQQVRSILYHSLACIEGPREERGRAVSAAKVIAGGAARVVGYGGVQLHGGYGMTEEFPVGHLLRHLVVLEKVFGDSDEHLRRFIELPRSS